MIKPAIIDIGSNSVRLMLPKTIGLNNKYIKSTMLGDGLSLSGKLNSIRILDTIDAIAYFISFAKQEGYKDVQLFATEAVRSAENKNDFLKLVKLKTGYDIDVIDGETEAYLGYLGACQAFDTDTQTIIDIGGASIEVITGIKGKIISKISKPCGVIRLRDLFKQDYNKVTEYIRCNFSEIKLQGLLIGISGTCTSLSAMNMKLNTYDAQKVHRSVIALAELENLKKNIINSKDLIKDYPILSPNRAKVISYGVIALLEIMKIFNATKITISEFDNTEGYLMYKNL